MIGQGWGVSEDEEMRVWIVFNDEERDLDIYGVFDNADDAERYAEEAKHLVPNGLKYAEYPVPWRLTDGSTTTAI